MTFPHDPAAPAPFADEPPTAVPSSVVFLLGQTRPWVKLLAILMIVGCGLSALVMIAAMAGIATAAPAGTPKWVFFPVLLMLGLYVPPALFLWRYADSIRILQAGGGQRALEEALGHQKSFWKYLGVFAAILLCLYALMFVVGMFVGVIFGR